MITKYCPKCKKEKPLEDFDNDKNRKYGKDGVCKDCRKKYREKNKEKIQSYHREYYLKNKKKIEIKNNKWRIKNYKRVRELSKLRYYKDIKKSRKEHRKYDKEYFNKYPWTRHLKSIKQRCYNPNNKSFKWYGGKGIKCYLDKYDIELLWWLYEADNLKNPSIDRENSNGNYDIWNCSFIEHNENCGKSCAKKVVQMTLDNNFIKIWPSLSEASRNNKGSIGGCCYSNQKTAGGFKWMYLENYEKQYGKIKE